MDDLTSGMATTAKIELAVNLTNEDCSSDITMLLRTNKSIKNVAVNFERQTVIVETALPTHEVVKIIEGSGKKALVTGVGVAGSQIVNLGSAVAIMHEGNPSSGVRGVARIVQSTNDICIVDGTLDGLAPSSEHSLAIHEYGDISDGCNSCGDILSISTGNSQNNSSLYGDIGIVHSDTTGRSAFRIESRQIKVWDVIGRSVVVKSRTSSSTAWTKLACGIIARSAGLFENFKKICACDGTTIWNEQNSQKRFLGTVDNKSSQL